MSTWLLMTKGRCLLTLLVGLIVLLDCVDVIQAETTSEDLLEVLADGNEQSVAELRGALEVLPQGEAGEEVANKISIQYGLEDISKTDTPNVDAMMSILFNSPECREFIKTRNEVCTNKCTKGSTSTTVGPSQNKKTSKKPTKKPSKKPKRTTTSTTTTTTTEEPFDEYEDSSDRKPTDGPHVSESGEDVDSGDNKSTSRPDEPSQGETSTTKGPKRRTTTKKSHKIKTKKPTKRPDDEENNSNSTNMTEVSELINAAGGSHGKIDKLIIIVTRMGGLQSGPNARAAHTLGSGKPQISNYKDAMRGVISELRTMAKDRCSAWLKSKERDCGLCAAKAKSAIDNESTEIDIDPVGAVARQDFEEDSNRSDEREEDDENDEDQ